MKSRTKSIGEITVVILLFALLFLSMKYYRSDRTVQFLWKKWSDQSQPSPVVHSNQWYSSLYTSFPTYPLYAQPLVYKISPSCFGISSPPITASSNAVVASYREDFCVELESPYDAPRLDRVDDWTVSLALASGKNELGKVTIGHGVPYAIFQTNSSEVVIKSKNALEIPSGRGGGENLGKTIASDTIEFHINGNRYALYLPKATTISITKTSLLFSKPKRFLVALLPDTKSAEIFDSIRNLEIVGTRVHHTIKDGRLVTDYTVETRGSTPFLALYPHQVQALTSPLQETGTYKTIRGDLKLFRTNKFTTSLNIPAMPVTFPSLADPPRDLTNAIRSDVATYINGVVPESHDYFFGTWLGRGVTLFQLAQAVGLQEVSDQVYQFVKPLLLERLQSFTIDTKQQSLISTRPEFGNEKLNDHHLHYGYFIRAASVFGAYDPVILPTISPQISEMVGDIATTQRTGATYPFLRTFDIYEGHSWADGYAQFHDGNNQESSSEAIHAWYAVFLWGKLTNNSELTSYAQYLFTTEVDSALEYWFNRNNIYQLPYQHAIASIVWGGKVDFATWFSPDVDKKYGIQLLPITPASLYLGTLSSWEKYEEDYQENGGKETEGWGNLFAMWKSFYKPGEVDGIASQIQTGEENHPRSLLLYLMAVQKNHPL